ncbi:MAG: AMP-binding protein, partial [Serpentinimonas sp.]|nr:AMP-binding protein [Serpentinimonas sp.]
MVQKHIDEACWPRGIPRELRVPRVTLSHYLQTAAQRYPDKPALIYCGVTISYSELQARVDAVAAWLQQRLGVTRGDRVLLMSQNCPEFLVAYYAVLRSGAAIVPVNPMSTLPEVTYYVQDSGARVAFVAQDLLPRVQPLLDEGSDGAALDALVVHAYSEGLPGHAVQALPEAMRFPVHPCADARVHRLADAARWSGPVRETGVGPDDLAVLPYTSGTTGHPKGCMHTHATILASNVASQVWRGLHTDSVFLCVAPLFHMLGMQNGMNMPMTLGATVVMMPRWDAARAVELVERHRISEWTAPPAMVIEFFSQPGAQTADLSSLALLSGGGAAMPEAVASMLAERYDLSYNEAYGLTETAAFLHANPVRRGKRQC